MITSSFAGVEYDKRFALQLSVLAGTLCIRMPPISWLTPSRLDQSGLLCAAGLPEKHLGF
jgi:hypothetical protein